MPSTPNTEFIKTEYATIFALFKKKYDAVSLIMMPRVNKEVSSIEKKYNLVANSVTNAFPELPSMVSNWLKLTPIYWLYSLIIWAYSFCLNIPSTLRKVPARIIVASIIMAVASIKSAHWLVAVYICGLKYVFWLMGQRPFMSVPDEKSTKESINEMSGAVITYEMYAMVECILFLLYNVFVVWKGWQIMEKASEMKNLLQAQKRTAKRRNNSLSDPLTPGSDTSAAEGSQVADASDSFRKHPGFCMLSPDDGLYHDSDGASVGSEEGSVEDDSIPNPSNSDQRQPGFCILPADDTGEEENTDVKREKKEK